MIDFIGKRRSMQLGARLEERQASDGVLRLPRAILHANVKVLLRGLPDLGTDPAAGIEVAAGKTHERADGRVLCVEIDVSLKRAIVCEARLFLGFPSVNVY